MKPDSPPAASHHRIDVLSKAIAVGICLFGLTVPCWGQGVHPVTYGVIKSISRSLLLVSVDDEHEMKFQITRKTKFSSQDKQGSHDIKASSLEAGQAVAVEAQVALDGAFEAVRVTLGLPKQ